MQEFDMYGGEIRLEFSEAAHRYRVSRKEVKSWSKPKAVVGVSTVLNTLNKPSLMTWPMVECLKHIGCTLKFTNGDYVWHVKKNIILTEELVRDAAKAYTRRSEAGKDIGKDIHWHIEVWLRDGGRMDSDDLVVNRGVNNFVKWFEESKARVLEIERVVYSKALDYAGTFDALLEVNGKTVLVDWKTSNVSKDAPEGIYPEAILQMGAYSLAFTEETGRTIDRLMVVNISKKDGRINTLSNAQLGWNVEDCERAFRDLLNVYRFHSRTANYIRKGVRL